MASFKFVLNYPNGQKCFSIPAEIIEQYYGPLEEQSYTFYTLKTVKTRDKIVYLDDYKQKKRDSLSKTVPKKHKELFFQRNIIKKI